MAAGSTAAGIALLSQRLDWGGEAVTLTVHSDGAVTVQSETSEPLSVRIPGAAPATALRSARAEVAAGGETRYLIIRTVRSQATPDGQQVMVLGKNGRRWASIYAGPIGPVGRDGEYSVAVEATPQGLLRYQRAPGVSRCDGEDRLFIERYHPEAGAGAGTAAAGGAWHPAPELALPEPSQLKDAPVITATARGSNGTGGAPLGVYRFVAASAQVGVQRADLLAPPQELEDGKPATAWRIPADARGAFATARADGAGHSVQALRITPAPPSQGALPRQLALVFSAREAGPRQRLLVDLSPQNRDAQWVQLPAPIASSCLSLLITQPAPGGQPTALGKVAIFSELDADTSDAGLRRLAERAAGADFTSAEAALRTLRALIERERSAPQRTTGAAALLNAVAAVLPGAQGAGRRRLHETLRALASGTPWPELAQTLVRALAQADPEERPLLWSAVEQLGPGVEPALLQLARDPQTNTAVRTEAVNRLGGRLGGPASPAAVRTLLELIAAEPPTERSLQRGAVAGLSQVLHCRAEDDPLLAIALSALPAPEVSSGDKPGATAVTVSQLYSAARLVEALGQALTGCPPAARARLSGRLASLWPRPPGPQDLPAGDATRAAEHEQAQFTLRYRILQSLERLAPPPSEAAALISRVLAQDPEPVLRQAAARAAVAGAEQEPGGEAIKAVTQALADGDPGVRLAALSALGEHRLSAVRPATEQALRSDRWPQVRRAAAASRAAQCPPGAAQGAEPVAALRHAVGDADEQVQRLALAGLGRCEGAAALDVYAERLKDADAAPALRSQACALLVRYGFGSAAAPQQAQAHAAVAAALRDLLADPAADERSAGTVISCARAVGELGDARDLPALMQTAAATASEVPPPIRQSALEAIGKICSRGPLLSPALRKDLAATFQSAAKDPEARVQAAAQRAQSRCP